MTKPEIQMTNQKANPNDESTAADAQGPAPPFFFLTP